MHNKVREIFSMSPVPEKKWQLGHILLNEHFHSSKLPPKSHTIRIECIE